MFSFKYTPENLRGLTFTTCLFGGLLWTTKYLDLQRKLISNDQGSNKENKLAELDFYENTSIKAVVSAFYFYLALNVNTLLTGKGLVDTETLMKGYGAVIVGVVCDCARYFEVRNWKPSNFWKK